MTDHYIDYPPNHAMAREERPRAIQLLQQQRDGLVGWFDTLGAQYKTRLATNRADKTVRHPVEQSLAELGNAMQLYPDHRATFLVVDTMLRAWEQGRGHDDGLRLQDEIFARAQAATDQGSAGREAFVNQLTGFHRKLFQHSANALQHHDPLAKIMRGSSSSRDLTRRSVVGAALPAVVGGALGAAGGHALRNDHAPIATESDPHHAAMPPELSLGIAGGAIGHLAGRFLDQWTQAQISPVEMNRIIQKLAHYSTQCEHNAGWQR